MFALGVSSALAMAAAVALNTTSSATRTEEEKPKDETAEVMALIQAINAKVDALSALVLAQQAPVPVAEVAPAAAEVPAPVAEEAAPAEAVDVTKTNRAFVFIKPHANTAQVQAVVAEEMAAAGVKVVTQGQLNWEQIGSKIDVHYGAIASKAVQITSDQLTVSAEGQKAFEEKFGLSWKEALEKNMVLNAKQACEKLNVDGDALEAKWRLPTTKLIKFGGGFYCGQLEDGLYVINGFYMQMRGKYTTEPNSITFYEVEFDPAKMSWQDFRANFLGATDPVKAAPSSLRRKIFDNWQALGLPACPDVGDNGMHGSASPFEAVAEIVNWENKPLESDPLGQVLLSKLDKATLELWLGDCQVPIGGGKTKSIFDCLEDLDTKDMLAKLDEIVAGLPAKPTE